MARTRGEDAWLFVSPRGQHYPGPQLLNPEPATACAIDPHVEVVQRLHVALRDGTGRVTDRGTLL